MLVHSLLVESVDLRPLGGSSSGNDFLSDRLDQGTVAPGEKKLGPFARKGACNSTADITSASVDHRNLVLQQHLRFLSPHELRSTAEMHLRVAGLFAIRQRQDRQSRRWSRHGNVDKLGAHPTAKFCPWPVSPQMGV